MPEMLGVNPWLGMWLHPRRTIRAIVEYNPRFRFLVLSGIYGLPLMLQISQMFSFAEKLPFVATILISLAAAPCIGVLGLSVAAAIFCVTGRWIGGMGSFLHVRAAISWANVTNIPNILLWAALIWTFRNGAFLHTFSEMHYAGTKLTVVGVVFLGQFVLTVWGWVLFVQALGEVQGFSAWKALVNVLIPFLLIFVAIWAVGWVLWSVRGVP